MKVTEGSAGRDLGDEEVRKRKDGVSHGHLVELAKEMPVFGMERKIVRPF